MAGLAGFLGRRRRAGCLGTLPLAAVCYCVAALVWRSAWAPAWLGTPATQGSASSEDGAVRGEGPVSGRRQLAGASLAAAAATGWAASPEAAEAFRADRIFNAKRKYIPKIRAFYQKLEGLRDDIYLEVEFASDKRRAQFAARPADWYDGLDSKMDGQLVLPTDETGFGCDDYQSSVSGKVVMVPRGRCSFANKVELAKAAGAKSVVVWDEKMSKMPVERQGKSGTIRSKGIATREAGDALTGGASLLPYEFGVTIMAPEAGKSAPNLDAVMINFANGTDIKNSLLDGFQVRVLDVRRFDFTSNIDAFVKKDLKKMLNEMEIYSNTMRESKDDFGDPIIKLLRNDREAFRAAVKSKDYGEIRRTFQQWNDHLDPLGKWELAEPF